ncbi:hypothetical protein ONS95_009487 [Cadophora gregata]|uniref:uncharacterized protein n=1 Tax=Cadophora gregata TaxID=51156 RepID=UPI0026DAFA95|nr:uncharacterized protein ONS95_009487 [Cadophora gregata]KAK0124537.1 hypothetical protein ONS95_009487 [Cadophora gregata]KAK0129610.1 hypothetical protein ONS96_000174 [Cadophora gregata f. sp. sojae]
MAGNNTGGKAHHHKRFSSLPLSESLPKGITTAHGSLSPDPQTLFFDSKASSEDDERLSPISISPPEHGHGQHTRNKSASSAQLTTTSTGPSAAREDHNYAPRMNRQSTFPSTQSEVLVRSPQGPVNDAPSSVSATPKQAHPRANRAGKNNNGSYPPLSMITQNRGHFFEQQQPVEVDLTSSTTDWVTQQQKQQSMTALQDSAEHQQQGQGGQVQVLAGGDDEQQPRESHSREPRLSLSRSQTEPASGPGRPLIKPIRGFKLSSQRKSTEMASRRTSYNDQDATLRALEGRDDNTYHAPSQSEQQDENNSDESSDLFLRAAREEELQAKSILNNTNGEGPARANSLRSRAPSGSSFQQFPESRFGQRASLPPPSSSSTSYHPSVSRRRGSDNDSSVNGTRPMDEQDSIAQALTYRPGGRDRPAALEDLNRSRYNVVNSRSSPTTPRGTGGREISPEQPSHNGRRPSIPEANLPQRTSYRQSNLSYTTPRTYNSSPLVSRTTDMHEVPETPRAAEGTESTVSTTAPSTVWDELEDLKSRIHRLELTGKLPPTSGAAMSRASHDRPPTATTTVTTMSSSPKQRGRGNSVSPVEASAEPTPPETHPLLHSALAKSKSLLNPELYRALEATASDALAISSMMGISGQPGPISSAQSTVGGTSSVSDRQVRRKADSMCRSLTELCLALSEGKNEIAPPVVAQPVSRPASRDIELPSIETNNTQRQLVSTDLNRVKSSPRALSRLEARRSSLLATSALPSPRYAPSEVGTPTQSTMAGRRTSLLLRSRRGGTEEPDEDDDTRFRAPSRATTEIGRFRNSPREYTSQQPLPERSSSIQSVQSSLPVRRHYQSTSLTNSIPAPTPPVSSLGGRRFLDRSTPERDTNSLVGRLAEDRGQRKSSFGLGNLQIGRTTSLNRRSLQPNVNDLDPGQQRHYQ